MCLKSGVLSHLSVGVGDKVSVLSYVVPFFAEALPTITQPIHLAVSVDLRV